MTPRLRQIITATEPSVRHQSLDALCRGASLEQLLAECDDLELFRRRSESLYERVRALFFLYALHRFHLPLQPGLNRRGWIPFAGWSHLLQRRFEEAVKNFLDAERKDGPNDALSSALAAAYYRLGIQTLADQVRRSVRSGPATNGCSAWATPPTSPCASGPNCCNAGPTVATPSCASKRPCAWT